jgi:hypothetical protein
MAFSVEKCNFSFQKQFNKRAKKCHMTFWLNPSLSLVSFGDTVAIKGILGRALQKTCIFVVFFCKI